MARRAGRRPRRRPGGGAAPDPELTARRLLGAEAGSRQRLWAGADGGAPVAVAALRLPGAPGAGRPGEIDIRVRPEHRPARVRQPGCSPSPPRGCAPTGAPA
ncbi:hypothetical protein [Actinomadura madurae]|uniref:hypothetical protein n=1 Tax=Actinomadura madurae TaxID=1993 RepID=UPI0020D25EC6|nr:hypothetical protein [Actinomadura madurae]MCQ0012129.1 hypothetical protein [Actinomadura madurae]